MTIYFQWCNEDDVSNLRCDFCKRELPDGEDFWVMERVITCLEDGHGEIEGSADLEVMCFNCDEILNARIKAVRELLQKKNSPSSKAKRKLTIPKKGEQ